MLIGGLAMKIRTKIFTLLALIVLLIYLVVPGNNIVFVTVDAEDSGSTIGGVEIEGLNEKDISSRLEKAIENWKLDGDLVLQGGGIVLPIDTSYFTFDIEASVQQFVNTTFNPWYAFWKRDQTVNQPLIVTADPEVLAEIEAVSLFVSEETYQNLLSKVSNLSNEPIEATIADLSIYEANRIAFNTESFDGNPTSLSNIKDQLNDTLIPTGDVYSLLDQVDSTDLYALNFVASMLYSIVLQTDYEIVERHSQNEIPTYLSAGIEAKVDRDSGKDFQFINHATAPSKLKTTIEGTTLKLELYTIPEASLGKYYVTDQKEVTPRIIERYSNDLATGKEQLIQEGSPGYRVSVYRTIDGRDELISKDFYPPINRIVLKSARQPEVVDSSTDPDLSIDLNGDGLPDYEEETNNVQDTTDQDTTDEEKNEGKDGLPSGMEYDKAGNIVPIETQS